MASDGTPLHLDGLRSDRTQGPWPAVLVIHGGDFSAAIQSDDGRDWMRARPGRTPVIIAFAIAYRLAPPGSIPGQSSLGRFPDQYDDVHLAVQAARNDARGNGQVGAVGGSAGANARRLGGCHRHSWGSIASTSAVCLSGSLRFFRFHVPIPNLDEFIATVTNYVGVPSTDTAALRAASPAWVLDATVAPLFLRRHGW